MKTLSFPSSAEFRSWLEQNHTTADGIWLRIFKKDSGRKSITYAEALDECLCFGWIRLGARIKADFREKVMEVVSNLPHRPTLIQMGCDFDRFILTESIL